LLTSNVVSSLMQLDALEALNKFQFFLDLTVESIWCQTFHNNFEFSSFLKLSPSSPLAA
jgi:hypothetical protein